MGELVELPTAIPFIAEAIDADGDAGVQDHPLADARIEVQVYAGVQDRVRANLAIGRHHDMGAGYGPWDQPRLSDPPLP